MGGICTCGEDGFFWLLVVHVAREFLAQAKIGVEVWCIVGFCFGVADDCGGLVGNRVRGCGNEFVRVLLMI